MFAEIISHLLPTGGKHDLGCDECLVVNQLWTYHRSAIRFLPPAFNINLHQNDNWSSNPVMQSYIYQFVGQTKKHLDGCRWQRTDPPELPYPWDQRAFNLIARFGQNPLAVWKASSCFHSDTIANLLAIYPGLLIQIDPEPILTRFQSDDIGCNDRAEQFAATQTSYLKLPKLLLRLGPNSSRLLVTMHDAQTDLI